MLIGEDNIIWNLYLEGAAEDMITSSLRKMNATPEEISLFLQKENGKILYKPEHVPTLFKWLKSENGNARELPDDYKNYQKYFPNVKLDQFKSYIDWTEKVHAKRDEASYQSRHKDIKDIEIEGQDKENVLADDEDVLILKGDDEHKCVRYGKGYSFCISRPYGGNMYGNYRLSKASTFYFIYFKKIPKEDERHIMVLDRTDNGWEWTFGKNKTKVIEGGWDEVVETFPVLEKYENLFVNKPLTSEEQDYQKKLKNFVLIPTKDKFDKFTYQQRADVLKFGMLIPIDMFESLDKYLRNEWVSVGPKMSDDIYAKLSSSEKDRFTKVREQQLTQREIEDKYDVEISKNNPELFDKHLKPDKELSEKVEKIINKKIKNGVFDGHISIDSKYFSPNLDKLKVVNGDISFDLITSLNLPQLQECSNIVGRSATGLNLPQLQECKSIHVKSATSLNLPKLQKVLDIYADLATSLSLPQLQECGNIKANSATSLSLPQLQHSGYIYANSATSLSLPQLQKSSDIYANSATSLSLPQLQHSGYIKADSATSLSLPQLQKSSDIKADSATSLSLPQLQRSRNIDAKLVTSLSLPQLQQSSSITVNSATSISLPQLQQCGNIKADSTTSLSLPQLQHSAYIKADSATSLSLPQLQKSSGDVFANSAKRIVIPIYMKSRINGVPQDCKIIEPTEKEELNDSTVYDLLKNYLLKS
jgi:hypothetical protein